MNEGDNVCVCVCVYVHDERVCEQVNEQMQVG
jgi:hypothetical protein